MESYPQFTLGVESGAISIVSGGQFTVTHNFGCVPLFWTAWIVNKIAEQGYNPGDIYVPGSWVAAGVSSFSYVPTNSVVNGVFANAAYIVSLKGKTNGNSLALTNANWEFHLMLFA